MSVLPEIISLTLRADVDPPGPSDTKITPGALVLLIESRLGNIFENLIDGGIDISYLAGIKLVPGTTIHIVTGFYFQSASSDYHSLALSEIHVLSVRGHKSSRVFVP